MGHATVDDLLEEMTECLESNKIDISKILQISMDGPNVNWKFHTFVRLVRMHQLQSVLALVGYILFILHSRLECRRGPLIFVLAICRLASKDRRFH